MDGRELFYRRQIFRSVVILLFLILAGNLLWMTGPKNAHYRDLALENRQIRFRVGAPRGRILDRTGRLLADNTFIADITMSSRDFLSGRCDSTLGRVALWCGLDSTSLRDRLLARAEDRGGRLTVISNADMAQVVTVQERRRELPGLRVETRPRRRYLQGPLFSHVIGHVGQIRDEELTGPDADPAYRSGDMIGRQGVEKAFESTLRGRAGIKLEEVNASGHLVGRQPLWLQEIKPGEDLVLTLDARLQRIMADALGKGAGCGVAISCRTGEVLAAVSKPDFDPNLLTVPISRQVWERLSGDARKPFFNRVLQATYPPASLYKPIVSLVAMKKGIVGQTTRLQPCQGGWQLGNRYFRCWKSAGHGSLDHAGALIHSCDTFYYQVALEMDLNDLAAGARAFGLGAARSGIFSEEVAGLVPDVSWYDEHYGQGHWSRGVVLNNSIGQGEILVTPLQMAVVAARLGVGNALPPITFVRGQKRVDPLPTLPFSGSDMAWMRQVLQRVVDEGTGKAVALEDVTVAGKTGTAQNPHGEDHAWFLCFAPVENPEVALAVIMENAGHGGSEAAPVAHAWLDGYFHGPARGEALVRAAGERRELH